MKLSIIIPVYKVEEYLVDCVESVVRQCEGRECEILLIDDGSPDCCPKICDELAEKYSHISVIHQSNHGPGSARNVGILSAKGQYCYFLDSDDELADDFFRRIRDNLDGINEVIFTKHIDEYDCLTKKSAAFCLNITESQSSADQIMSQASRIGYGVYLLESIKKYQLLFSTKRDFCEDDTWLFALLQKIEVIKVINIPYYIYKVNRIASIVNSVNEDRLLVTIEETLSVVNQIDNSKFGNKDELKTKYANRMLDYILRYRLLKTKTVKRHILDVFNSSYSFLKNANARISRLLCLRKIFGSKLCLLSMSYIRFFTNGH